MEFNSVISEEEEYGMGSSGNDNDSDVLVMMLELTIISRECASEARSFGISASSLRCIHKQARSVRVCVAERACRCAIILSIITIITIILY